ncbi:MAG: hypothetical protein UT13_C0001G0664 [Candidatus Pacebacteria bacterium GW2011_GWF2_38_9]|nr:MAG: hypothetical protein US01_C0001G0693 [candidate division TM6 bacterium GW2011_GWF2_28_16]KKQ08653.1 MAG: hypothetical protein US20_C0013G0003 [Candidatus Pacebacteria bacterium GW2011_GWF1_36_5]KKQ89017.1 MAG: hypothetical protein UT13_C0001G0664 [Candidatus Pacebacteria bacterium GW2011_GWF2_38_9]HAZ73193.1 hypothetical protein [Candidatus Paceibacterota bacterium]
MPQLVEQLDHLLINTELSSCASCPFLAQANETTSNNYLQLSWVLAFMVKHLAMSSEERQQIANTADHIKQAMIYPGVGADKELFLCELTDSVQRAQQRGQDLIAAGHKINEINFVESFSRGKQINTDCPKNYPAKLKKV